MRDILPLYFNILEGEVIFVDPKNECERLWQTMIRNDRKNPRAIYCGDHKHPNINLTGKLGQGKTIYPIEDETHRFYNPETEKIANKLRARATKKEICVQRTINEGNAEL